MTLLDGICPTPRKLEVDSIELALSPDKAWELVRHGDLGRSPLTHALFWLRTLPTRLTGGHQDDALTLRIDDLTSTPDRPGFSILAEAPGREVVVGAIGKVWQLDIPFVHVATAAEFTSFQTPDFVKVAWALLVEPLGDKDAKVTFEVRVDATDEASWKRFQKYFLVIGPGSHFIRRSVLGALVREYGTPASKEDERPLRGDELLPDASGSVTHGVTIAAEPEAIWPWLVQMGGGRAGFYSVDVLDNAGIPSAYEIHPELQALTVGEVIPATPEGKDGFEVLALDGPHALILGGLFDPVANTQLPFASARPAAFWHMTWAFVLERLGESRTRLHVRVRAAFSPDQRAHATWIVPAHRFMESAQLRHLRSRVEKKEPRDHVRDVAEGVSGAGWMMAAFLSPFLRHARSHWGIDEATAARTYPGDERIASPRWGWTHGITIEASAEEVWPWIAQIGADRAGFYSYQWLENIAGCEVKNAEALHPEWAVKPGGGLILHPKMPPIPVVELVPGKYWVAFAGADPAARAESKPWIETSWLFWLEPTGPRQCRFVSRFRCDSSEDLGSRLAFGETMIEPIGFAMDRRMLMGVKERAERAAPSRTPT
jgi:hypothetical protein